MSKYHTELGFLVTNFGTEDNLDEHLDCVLDALLEDDRAMDADYTAALAKGQVEFSLSVEAADELRAHELALVIMRAAIHCADGGTRGWETHFEQIQTLIREADAATLEMA